MAQRGIQIDIKDLQFIRDVLKDASFSNTKWFDLGLKLKLLEPDLEAISSASNDASHCLMKCLALWLKSGKATPQLLVRSLESVDEVSAAQYARKIFLDAASKLLLSYRDKLSKLILNDDLVGLLRLEGVITNNTQEMIIEYGNMLDDEPLRAVCVTVADNHQKLKVLADVLLQFTETAPLGRDLAEKYCQIFPEVFSQTVLLQATAQQPVSGNTQQPVSDEGIHVSAEHEYNFDTIRGDYGIFLSNVKEVLSSKISVSTEELKYFLNQTYPELTPEITHAQTINAIIDIVGGRVNIINIAKIETIIKRYDISEAKDLVTQYKEEIQKFTHDMKLEFVLDKKLSPPISSLICETIEFVLDWEPSDHSLDDIRRLFKKAFGNSNRKVIVRSIHKGNSIIIICYAPRYLINVLLLEAQANLHVLKEEMNLIRLDVGHFTVYNKKEGMIFKEELEQSAQEEKEREFPANSRYGSIERRKFCLLGIVGEEKNGGKNNGEQQEQSNGGQEENNGEQQEQRNGHEDLGDEESSEDERKGGGRNRQKGSGQQQQGGGGEGEGKESGGQEQLQKSHREEENEKQQTKGEEVHQKLRKEKQQHGSEHYRPPTQEEKRNSNNKEDSNCNDVMKAPEECTESDQSTSHETDKCMMSSYEIVVSGHSTGGIHEASVYTGQVFYERKNLMRFTAAKDLNALRKYIKNEYRHSEIDRCFTFKLDSSLGYIELTFDGPQSKPTTGWSVHSHLEPCRIYEDEMAGFDGISSTHPPSCLVSIYAESSSTTAPVLNYSVPLKGALNVKNMKPIKFVIIRSLSDILSGTNSTTSAPAAASLTSCVKSDPDKCAQDALNAHSEDLKELLSDMSIFGDVASACKQPKIITSSQYQGIFDETNHKTVSQRVDQFMNCVISVVKYCPKQLEVFLNILIDKGNIALEEVAERVAQSFNTEVPDQYHIILTES